MATIKIKNNEPRVHTIGYRYGGVAAGHGTSTKSFRLLPGVNEVDSDAWAQAKKLAAVAFYVKTGAFQELGGSKAGLAAMGIEGARDLISQTMDRELLKRWKTGETRAAVLAAIDAQIDATTYVPGRDDQDNDGIDLKPAQNPHALDGAAIASQVAASTEELDGAAVEDELLPPLEALPPSGDDVVIPPVVVEKVATEHKSRSKAHGHKK